MLTPRATSYELSLVCQRASGNAGLRRAVLADSMISRSPAMLPKRIQALRRQLPNTHERNKNMKEKLFSTLLLSTFLWFGSCLIARSDPPLACCDVIQLTNSQVEDCTAKGQFEPVVVAPVEAATVTLQFDASLAGSQVVVQALDGGTLGINGPVTIDADGSISFPFQVGDQPGLYRVSVVAQYGSEDLPLALVQFQVPNPDQ